MSYREKLSYVLKAAALVSPEDLEQLYNLASSMDNIEPAEKIQKDRAALCSYVPYLDENDTELLTMSARMCSHRE